MNERNRETGTEQSYWADAEIPERRKRPMVTGAKFGLALSFLYVAFIAFAFIAFNVGWARPMERMLTAIPDSVARMVFYSGMVLLGIASLVTGIQKGRPYIGVLAAILTPIGFLIALAVENRSTLKASERTAPAGSMPAA
jgi:hypothetical protein